MDKSYKQRQSLTLGASTIAAALALGASPTLYAAPTAETCTPSKDKDCKTEQVAPKIIEEVRVHGVRHSVYKHDKSGDLRRVADLKDTPQVINVLTQDQIQESGSTDLEDILSAQAGVTLGTGENGNAFGDRYIIRGHEARSDVFVDGMRDPGMTTRESFATERVEIAKGPSATFAGRGTSGGAVNSITKKASTAYNFGRVDAGIGTDDYTRLTLDYNAAISDTAAVRANALWADETKPGREGIEAARSGVQLSGVLEATDKLSFIADAYYLKAEDVPDLGSYFDREARKPIEDIPVYAQSEDFQNSEVSTFTLRTTYEISESLRFYNATRAGATENEYIVTGLRSGKRHATDTLAPNTDTFSLSDHQGSQEVDYVASQFNLFWDVNTGGLEHKWVFGVEYSDESVENGTFTLAESNAPNCALENRRNPTGDPSDGFCIMDGSGNFVSNIQNLMGRTYTTGIVDSTQDIQTVSVYAMDTVNLSDTTKLFFGVRVDSFDFDGGYLQRGATEMTPVVYSDENFNGHLGLVQDVAEGANVYISYSTATNINGGESDLGGNCGYGGICGTPEQAVAASPERVENIELGTKWSLGDDELLLSAALFQMTKSDVMESVGADDYAATGTLNTGENRVKGLELGAVGEITEKLSVQFSAAIMDSEVTGSFEAENVGLALSNFADKSAYLQLRYEPNATFAFGGNITYQSEMYGGQPDSAAGYSQDTGEYSIVVPSYSFVNLFANYNVTETFTLRANLGNVFDKEYWTAAYRSGAFMYLGDGRNARLTATYEF